MPGELVSGIHPKSAAGNYLLSMVLYNGPSSAMPPGAHSPPSHPSYTLQIHHYQDPLVESKRGVQTVMKSTLDQSSFNSRNSKSNSNWQCWQA